MLCFTLRRTEHELTEKENEKYQEERGIARKNVIDSLLYINTSSLLGYLWSQDSSAY